MNFNTFRGTLVLWFSLSSVMDQNTLLSVRGNDWQMMLQYDPTNDPPFFTYWLYANPCSPIEVFKTLEANTEYKIAVYYDGENAGLWVDGEWHESQAPTELYEDSNLRFQAVYNDANAGPVSCSRFEAYPRVLTASEVDAL